MLTLGNLPTDAKVFSARSHRDIVMLQAIANKYHEGGERVDSIFLITADGTVREARAANHRSEDDFQRLLESHPDLLSGARIRPEDPLRWFLVGREAAVQDTESGQSRWSLDHLFIDQDGTPTLVEVKRATDTRLRREVVGQMFDYAANAQIHWNAEMLRKFALRTHGSAERLRDALLQHIHGGPAEVEDPDKVVEDWWHEVEDRLRRGAMRLLFVADRIPPELKRIIEFLNEQMENVEVLGVELALYSAEEHSIMVPRICGQTESARAQKSRGPLGRNVRRTFEDISKSASSEVSALLKWMSARIEGLGWVPRPGKRCVIFQAEKSGTSLAIYIYPAWSATDPACIEVFYPNTHFDAPTIEHRRSELVQIDPHRLSLAGARTVRMWILNESDAGTARTVIESALRLEGL